MADLSKFKKKRGTLGSPPSMEEASPNLQAPEIAPLAPASDKRRDGRSLRRTNRTLPFATRVSADFDNRLRDIAERDGLKLVELLEQSLEAYESQK